MTGGFGGAIDAAGDPLRRKRVWLSGLIAFSLLGLLCVAAAEITARLYWRLCCDIPLRHPEQILLAYYPELRASGELPEAPLSQAGRRPAQGDEFYDVLLLGGSVLHKGWGTVETELREQLAELGHRKVRIFNLAMPAHTSRDSLLKYAALESDRFDLVVFYHGINDARVNNAPPEIFRDDYAHYSWYEAVNTLAPYHGTAFFALPYTLRYLAIRVRHRFATDRYIPTYVVREEWIDYGRESRSATSFRSNLSAILDLASRRGERVMLMTFALYIPTNYSRDAFRQKQLDYRLHRAPLEWWGRPEHVERAVAAHNDVVHGLAAHHPGVLFVDQVRLMPGSSRYFNDACHLTAIGSAQFVANMARVLARETSAPMSES